MSLDLVQHPYVRALAWTLVHFLWQGAIVGVVAFAILRIGRLSAPARYGVGVATLGVLLAAPIATFMYVAPIESASRPRVAATSLAPTPAAAAVRTSAATDAATLGEATTATPAAPASPRLLAWLVGAWFIGVIALSVRFLGGWIVARRLARRAVTPVAPDIQALAQRVAARLSLTRVVSIFESTTLSVPVMIGWLAPAVLIPAAALSGLTPTQIESLLAHELAHVRRHDYLVNLLQSAVETLLFYHPAVWWISRQVRRDRELCCDDIALTVCDRLVYASALTDLAALATPRFALAATDGHLVTRVRRILGQSGDDRESGSTWMPAVILAAMIGAFVPGVVATRASDAPATPIALAPAVLQTQAPGTVAPSEHTSTPPPQQTAQTTSAPARTTTAQARAEDQARQDADEIRRRYEEAQQALFRQAEQLKASQMQLDDIARRKLELQMASQEAAALDRINAIKASLDATQAELAHTKDRVAKGLVGQDAVQAVEYQVAAFQRQLDTAIRERSFQSQASQLQIAEIGRQRDVDQLQAQYEAAQRNAEAARSFADQLRERNRDFETTRADIEPTELSRAGDSFIVDIAGEPDLPRVYDMRADGTIRLPLIGMIKVIGLNAKQTQDAIGKLLADRRLGSAVDVTVAIKRSQK